MSQYNPSIDEPTFSLADPNVEQPPSSSRAERIAYLEQLMAPDWASVMHDQADRIKAIGDSLLGRAFLPEGPKVLRAFAQPFVDVRVVIVGQDPYPTPGHPIGLSFAVDKDVSPLPKSLVNIYAELKNDLGIEPVAHGDLSRWSEQGVMLLNRSLTVSPGQAGSHRGMGWEEVTLAAITALGKRSLNHGTPLVAILWGRQAQELEPVLVQFKVPVIKSAHPSPLSAHGGFFGSKPFSRTNAILQRTGGSPVDWRVEP